MNNEAKLTKETDVVSQPAPKKHSYKVIFGAVAVGIFGLALGICFCISAIWTSTTSDAEVAVSAITSTSATASSSAASASSAAASSSASAASSNAAASADPTDKAQAESSETGTQAAPAGTSSTPAGGGSTTPAAQPTHVHSWEPITAEIQVGEEPIYQEVSLLVCSDGFTCHTDAEMSAHKQAAGRGANLSHYVTYENIQVGTQPIYETQVIGYRCSGCGEQK